MDQYVYAWTCLYYVCVYLCQTWCFGVWVHSCADCPCELVQSLALFSWFYRTLYLQQNNENILLHFIEDSKTKICKTTTSPIFDERAHACVCTMTENKQKLLDKIPQQMEIIQGLTLPIHMNLQYMLICLVCQCKWHLSENSFEARWACMA